MSSGVREISGASQPFVLAPAARTELLRCAYCHDTLAAASSRCGACRTYLHSECWELAQACPTLGCEGEPEADEFRWWHLLLALLVLFALPMGLALQAKLASAETIVVGGGGAVIRPANTEEAAQLALARVEVEQAKALARSSEVEAQAGRERRADHLLRAALRAYGRANDWLWRVEGVPARGTLLTWTDVAGLGPLRREVDQGSESLLRREWSRYGRESSPRDTGSSWLGPIDLERAPVLADSELRLDSNREAFVSALGGGRR